MRWQAVLNCGGHGIRYTQESNKSEGPKVPCILELPHQPWKHDLHGEKEIQLVSHCSQNMGQSCVLTNAYRKFKLLINIT